MNRFHFSHRLPKTLTFCGLLYKKAEEPSGETNAGVSWSCDLRSVWKTGWDRRRTTKSSISTKLTEAVILVSNKNKNPKTTIIIILSNIK